MNGVQFSRRASWLVVTSCGVGTLFLAGLSCTRHEDAKAPPRVSSASGVASPAVAAQGGGEARSAALIQALRQSRMTDAERDFDDRLRQAVPESKLASVWQQATVDKGAFVGVERVRRFHSAAGDAEITTLRLERGYVDVRVTFDEEGRMGSIFIRPSDVIERAMDLVTSLESGHEDEAFSQFSPRMQGALPLEKLRAFMSALHAQHGALVSVEDARVSTSEFDSVLLEARFEKDRLDIRVSFSKDQPVVEGLHFVPPTPAPDPAPPSYALPAEYVERELRVGQGPRGLPGTLSMPRGNAANVPGVVLVAGSGPHDRDETLGANRPFRDLALGLSSRHIAVLRYEKRTFGVNATFIADKTNVTIDDDTTDAAVEAVHTLMTVPGVDPTRVYVVGHSLGAMMAPRVAEREPRVAGLVLLAAPARPMEDLIVEQQTYLASLLPSYPKDQLDEVRRQVARVKSPDLASARPEELPNHVPASFWLSLRGYDPVARALALKKATLVLQGDRDFQVTGDDFALWKRALATEVWATVELVPGLNHALEQGSTPPTPADYERAAHVDPRVVEIIAGWIDAHGGAKGAASH